MNNDISEIVQVLERYQRLANRGDAQGVSQLYSENAILIPDRFDVFEHVANIGEFYRTTFGMLALQLEFSIDPKLIFVHGDIGYATTHSTGTRYIKATKQTVPEINRELWVFERISNQWKIVRYCFNKSE